MEREGRVVKLANPHGRDIGEGLLKKILAEAGVSLEEWLGEQPEAERAQEEPAALQAREVRRTGRRGSR
jgi:hypothetical protein